MDPKPPITTRSFETEADVTAWLTERRPGAVVTIDELTSLSGRNPFRRFSYQTPKVYGYVTFDQFAGVWSQNRGGGRYGARSLYENEERQPRELREQAAAHA